MEPATAGARCNLITSLDSLKEGLGRFLDQYRYSDTPPVPGYATVNDNAELEADAHEAVGPSKFLPELTRTYHYHNVCMLYII